MDKNKTVKQQSYQQINQSVEEKNQKKIKIFLKTNNNEDLNYQSIWEIAY